MCFKHAHDGLSTRYNIYLFASNDSLTQEPLRCVEQKQGKDSRWLFYTCVSESRTFSVYLVRYLQRNKQKQNIAKKDFIIELMSKKMHFLIWFSLWKAKLHFQPKLLSSSFLIVEILGIDS